MRRATQSLLCAVIYSILLVAVMGPIQWLVVQPLCALRPTRRARIARRWLRLNAHLVLGSARLLGGLKLRIRGSLPATSCVVLMNHQSLLDIPIGVSLIRGPCPVIPTRDRYTRGVPVISGMARLSGFPSLKQQERATRAEHQAMVRSAEAVGRGDRSLLIFPEGHRSRDGEILPFMTSGLRLMFRHASQRPLYLVVAEGMWRLRSLSDIVLRLAGSQVLVEVLGPYQIPADPGEQPAFAQSLHDVMVATLERMRASGPATAPDASAARLAG
ncbi:MAG: 1-acyl-sn-glycerol-3-phosphate acyltransferase [Candidatus Eisenbacteria bacterium]|uniref:1-acyl-sn-glycerol-3-phosphate acyltransferase n=1 Tax=Eiseniibacteriota bacterium TaxID=2212470 RepID=A0A538UB83_UNCEI|nr:MAG: 1-acyl-sn-glycerol-3-phosphate acyltransferase [Candidatus Eisenbacteria bacterium]